VSGEKRGGGINLLDILGVAFIALKIAGAIDWPWWLVVLPLVVSLIAAVVNRMQGSR
jgi:hypothetical protein